jgi:N utilization substance protein A
MIDRASFLSALGQIAEEKGIGKEKIIATIEAAIAAAYRRDYGKRNQEFRAEFDEKTGKTKVFRVWRIVEDGAASNPEAEITLSEAKKKRKDAKVGEAIEEEVASDAEYGRIAAQTAKQVIIQRLREAEREVVYDAYKDKAGTVMSGIIQRIEGGNVFVDLGRATGILFPSEQVEGEHYRINQRLKFYVMKVELTSRGTDILLSRSHPDLLKQLFYLEVPEIYAGTVEIKEVAREAGTRAKIAVAAKEEGIDPVGACIGQRGTRIQTVIAEVGGEKIDVVEWSDDPAQYVANALSPARVVAVDIREDEHRALAHVEEDQLSLAIGRRGQNVRLAARLTGWRIDVVRVGEEEKVAASSEEGEESKKEEGEGVAAESGKTKRSAKLKPSQKTVTKSSAAEKSKKGKKKQTE